MNRYDVMTLLSPGVRISTRSENDFSQDNLLILIEIVEKQVFVQQKEKRFPF